MSAPLKLQFDPNQTYQHDAIASIVDVFKGQSPKNAHFTVVNEWFFGMEEKELGIANKLELDDEDLLQNVINIQDRNYLPRSKSIIDDIYKLPNFAIEMETGTGKTYVYIRTIFELYQNYGFSKFIIVVPWVAIREWVYKSLETTKEHFQQLYDGVGFDFFKYDSDKLTQVKDFATASHIQIMIINIDAFRKGFGEDVKDTKAALIHRESDQLQGRKPIDFIRETNPIVIIDEPQSVDNTDKAKEAIQSLNPLCILRYSATHREKYNLLYRLWPVEAYEQKLVKQIEVLPVTGQGDSNTPYMKLVSVEDKNGYSAKLELDIIKAWSVKRQTIIVNPNRKNNLYLLSGERDMYQWYIVEWINCNPWYEAIEFNDGRMLKLGEVQWNTDDLEIKRAQIRGTIMSHLDKEMMLLSKGIKVISLFFIDRVDKYREYGEDGAVSKGIYAEIFEEEYFQISKYPKYQHIFVSEEWKSLLQVDVDKIHDGYFSMDKKWKLKDSTERGNADDADTFKLIMQDKERLLRFDTPLRFIFSHSALKEWWDSPNVFQICTLVETVDTFTKRQKIGRWLRLPVDQGWLRIKDQNLNILTVVANESYQQFADTLQKEMEEATGVKFGYLEPQIFGSIVVTDKDNWEKKELGYHASEKIYNHLLQKEYISKQGRVQESLKQAIVQETLMLPEEFGNIEKEIISTIMAVVKQLPVKNANERVEVKLHKQMMLTDEFKNLREKIKYKTYYQISFDVDNFVEDCIHDIMTMDAIPASKIILQWVKVNIEQKGVTTQDPHTIRMVDIPWYRNNLPDVVRIIEESTGLKRSTIVKILTESKRLDADFVRNPQKFVEKVISLINDKKKARIIDVIYCQSR